MLPGPTAGCVTHRVKRQEKDEDSVSRNFLVFTAHYVLIAGMTKRLKDVGKWYR